MARYMCMDTLKFLLFDVHKIQELIKYDRFADYDDASINILYSGTMSAAMEASLEGIPSIGFSLLDFSFDADFSEAKQWASSIIKQYLEEPPENIQLINVNIPKKSAQPIKGIRLCRQGEARWIEKFVEGRDPSGQPYYWLSGQFVADEKAEDTDVWALEQGFISVVPSMHDLTDYKALANSTNRAFFGKVTPSGTVFTSEIDDL